MALVNSFIISVFCYLASWKDRLVSSVQEFKVQYNGWFVVLAAVLLTLAFSIYAGLTIWCVTYKGMAFSGSWNWKLTGISVNAKCV
ncbi:hypothetical protein J7E52_25540 [Bacillus sp. ISL-34]|uniref:hypothetical protein n=1 Tax=Bacillus sp. ISL-34 TaxID=2819121 RepID=UPI001BE5C35F|nr:hypothetical protein [Bacillus sp. ISL-34]MBT2650021.1 hypothetical protein [Bacillus sp. ISL-34]